MKAVILAGGKGTRMGDLSLDTPKPILKVLGKTLIEHKLLNLPNLIDEVVIVVGHLQNKIVEVLGDNFGNLKISYVVQEEQKGTADALFCAADLLKDEERFLVMMGDDIYSKEDISECLQYDYSILISEVLDIKGKAKVVFDSSQFIEEIREKCDEVGPGFINTGLYTMTPKIFEKKPVAILGGEVGLPQTLLSMKDSVKIKVVKSRLYIQITSPEDLLLAEKILG